MFYHQVRSCWDVFKFFVGYCEHRVRRRLPNQEQKTDCTNAAFVTKYLRLKATWMRTWIAATPTSSSSQLAALLICARFYIAQHPRTVLINEPLERKLSACANLFARHMCMNAFLIIAMLMLQVCGALSVFARSSLSDVTSYNSQLRQSFAQMRSFLLCVLVLCLSRQRLPRCWLPSSLHSYILHSQSESLQGLLGLYGSGVSEQSGAERAWTS